MNRMNSESEPKSITPAELLSSIRLRIRDGEFGGTLLADADQLVRRIREFTPQDVLRQLKSLNSAAEVYDYFGRYHDGRRLLSVEGARAYSSCKTWTHPPSEEARAILKEKTVLLLNFGLTHYRANECVKALEILGEARRLIVDLIKTEDDPCHSSRSVLEYFCGQLYRQRLDFSRASIAFTASIEHAEKRVRWCRLHPRESGEARLLQEERRARRRTALALALGLGWMAARQGALQQALPLFLTARGLLLSTGDWVGKAYVELLYGTVQRAMAGFDPEKLREAVEILELPYRAFSPSSDGGHGTGHLPYKGHAAYQLALANLYAKDFAKCATYTKEVRGFAEATRNERWKGNSMIVESRLFREQGWFQEAAALATNALDHAREFKDRPCEIDSLIARGEAKLNLGGHDAEALEDFRAALDKVRINVQTEAMCHVHIAVAYLRMRDSKSASDHIEAWKRIKPRIENQVVLSLAARAETDISKMLSDFHISRSTRELSFKVHQAKLWDFLIDVAKSRYPDNKKAIAAALAVGRQRLYPEPAKGSDSGNLTKSSKTPSRPT